MSSVKEKSSSAGVVFAKPTKQWVLPERAKPGRKPKAKPEPARSATAAASTSVNGPSPSSTSAASTSTPSASASTPSTSSAASINSSAAQTNREAQRNFRLRKSSYITSLETRIAAFERGEFERSKEIQASALAVKEENEVLKKENRRLRSEVGVLRSEIRKLKVEAQQVAQERERERRRLEMMQQQGAVAPSAAPSPLAVTMGSAMKKKASFENSPMVSGGTPITPPSDHTLGSPPNGNVMQLTSNNGRRPIQSLSISTSTSATRTTRSFDELPSERQDTMMACGFCTDVETVCVCRMVAEADGADPSPAIVDRIVTESSGVIPSFPRSSILDHLPPPEAAVPLPRRQRQRRSSGLGGSGLSWWIEPVKGGVAESVVMGVEATTHQEVYEYVPTSLAQCSGDPRNCDACRDDDFGRQFCERLTSTVCADSPCGEQCTKCNGRSTSTDSEPRSDELMPLVAFSNSHSSTDIKAPCCGDGELCGGKPNACSHRASSDDGGSITLPSIADALDHVARNDSEMESRDEDTMGADEAWRTLKAHPNAQYASLNMLADVVARRTKCYGPRVELSPPPPETGEAAAAHRQLVPLDELVVNRNKRRLEVQADAVRDALALLDAQPRKRMKMVDSDAEMTV